MKFNWGHGITIVIILFMAFIVTLVVKTFNGNADLVQDNFYEQEVLFDGKKQSIANYKTLDFKVEVNKIPEGIQIKFPNNYCIKDGNIEFYKADNKSLDKNYKLILDDDFSQLLPYDDFVVGPYEVNIKWNTNEVDYLHQSKINF